MRSGSVAKRRAGRGCSRLVEEWSDVREGEMMRARERVKRNRREGDLFTTIFGTAVCESVREE
jgi:hypothetical protein